MTVPQATTIAIRHLVSTNLLLREAARTREGCNLAELGEDGRAPSPRNNITAPPNLYVCVGKRRKHKMKAFCEPSFLGQTPRFPIATGQIEQIAYAFHRAGPCPPYLDSGFVLLAAEMKRRRQGHKPTNKRSWQNTPVSFVCGFGPRWKIVCACVEARFDLVDLKVVARERPKRDDEEEKTTKEV